MKICLRKKLLFLAVAATAFILAGCEPSDAEKDYGFPKIYIPQATITGLDNSYPIPNGPFGQNSKYTCNYKDGKLNIALGVVRAGAIAKEKAFTVDLKVSQSETDRKLAELEAKGTPAQALPTSICNIPDKISVEAGENTGTCYVSVDLKALSASSLLEGDVYKQLILGLEIANPTEYELAESNTSVVIILNLNDTNWDNLAEDIPESEVRKLFPLNTTNQ